jgi:hypothetical protein
VELHDRTGGFDGDSQGIQHALRVVARHERLLDQRRPRGIETGQEQRALDLRARDFERVIERSELRACVERPDLERRSDIVRALRMRVAADHGAARPKRGDHASHRPLRERRVADEPRLKRLCGKHTRQQAHRGSGVSAIELGARSLQAE